MDKLITLFAVALGWILNELSSSLRVRREDRRAAGPILKDLLEIRHQLITLDAATKELGKQVNIPLQAQLQLKQLIQSLAPQPSNFMEKYEEAVSVVSHADPVLAFRLANQPLVGQVMSLLSNLAASDQLSSELWNVVAEPELLGWIKTHLEGLILDVARTHGWWTWWRVRRRLRGEGLSQSDKDNISKLLITLQSAVQVPKGN